MSLVLTELSHFGVAMAADSAVTFDDDRVFIGLQKLLPIPCLNGGLSTWGLANINSIGIDEWLQDFISKDASNMKSLWELARKLAEKLNDAFGEVISERMGIHVGGFDEKNGIRGPAFYHIHNGHYHIEFRDGQIIEVPDENPPIREFRAHEDRPPAIYQLNDIPKMTRNGDFSIFSFLFDRLVKELRVIQDMTGLTFPFPQNIETRGEYLRFWINLTKEIYRLSNYRKRILPEPVMSGEAHIGGPVIVLTISDSGIKNFYSK